MADSKRTPVLNLDSLTERRAVRFEGTDYDLLNPEEVSILDYHRIVKQAHRIDEIMGSGKSTSDLSEAEVAEMTAALDRAVRMILRAPDEVHAKFSDLARLAIISVFSDLQRSVNPPAATATAPPTETPTTSTSGS